ncbi:MAG: response regulator [bacterium]|nr:response regulator [bacterium]
MSGNEGQGEAGKHAILLVDDEPSILNALQRALRREPYTLFTANDCMSAMQLMATHEFAVVISDYTMPEMTGAELLAVMESRNPRCIRIMLTGATKAQSVPQPIADSILHCHKFLTKPWDDDSLRSMIRQSLEEYVRTTTTK